MILENLSKINHEVLHVEIELSGVCNANCVHCPRENMPKQSLMDDKTFKNIVSKYKKYRKKIELNKTTAIETQWPKFVFSGGGEPILNPRIFEFIKLSKKEGFSTKIYSNAASLTDEKIKNLIDSGIDEISISCIGIKEKEFTLSMGHNNFKETFQNIFNLRDSLVGKPIKFYVTYNALDILDSSDYEIHTFWKNHKIECRGPYAVWSRGGQLNKFGQKRKSLDKNKTINFSQEVWCLRLQHYDSIDAKGNFVYCCCGYFNKDSPILGNINVNTLEEIHLAYERTLRQKFENKMCSSCVKPNETYLIDEIIQFLENNNFRF